MKVNARISLDDGVCYFVQIDKEKVLVSDNRLITEQEARDVLKHELLKMVACLSSEKIKVVNEKETKEDRT